MRRRHRRHRGREPRLSYRTACRAIFNTLKKCGAEAGDTVAILGIGGLGHLALQYPRRMGFRVIAIGRGADIAQEAFALGAHRYIDTLVEVAVAAHKQLRGAQAIVATIGHAATVSALFGALTPTGRLVLLGGGKEPLAVPIGPLVVREWSIAGSINWTPQESERTLEFRVLADMQPQVEVVPLRVGPRRLRAAEVRSSQVPCSHVHACVSR